MEHIDLGSVPGDEPCAQLGRDGYAVRAKHECRALMRQLIRTVGEPPDGARFRIQSNPHDFGTYYSLAIHFDPACEDALTYAVQCDEASPRYWDDAAREELQQYLLDKEGAV